jgi:hypothetical protein
LEARNAHSEDRLSPRKDNTPSQKEPPPTIWDTI